MTQNMKEFVEQIEKNTALKAELEAVSNEYGNDRTRALGKKDEITQKTTAIAAKYGFTLTDEDFRQEAAELTPEQLDAVSGGGGGGYNCTCIFGGEGKGFDIDYKGWCVCAIIGYGGSDDGSGNTAIERCICEIAGFGWE